VHRQRWKSTGVCCTKKFICAVAVESDDQNRMRVDKSTVEKDLTSEVDKFETISSRFQHDGDKSGSDFGE
jgi:hypothetical protein